MQTRKPICGVCGDKIDPNRGNEWTYKVWKCDECEYEERLRREYQRRTKEKLKEL